MKRLLSIFSMLMLAAASYAATVNIAWDSSTSTGLQSYKVYRAAGSTTIVAGTTPSSNPNALLSATTTQLNAAVGGLADGPWCFSVTALGTNGLESVFGNVVSITVANLPAAPSGFSATVISQTQIRVNWTDNANNELNYVIERSTDGVNFPFTTTVVAGSTQYNDSGLVPNTLYYYRVKATNSAGSSGYAPVVSARTLANVPPAPPTNLRITSVGP